MKQPSEGGGRRKQRGSRLVKHSWCLGSVSARTHNKHSPRHRGETSVRGMRRENLQNKIAPFPPPEPQEELDVLGGSAGVAREPQAGSALHSPGALAPASALTFEEGAAGRPVWCHGANFLWILSPSSLTVPSLVWSFVIPLGP